ncbi:MAG: hypothetical protein ABI131_00190, partial [Nostocoides sp.]
VRERDQAWADALLALDQAVGGRQRLAPIAGPSALADTTSALLRGAQTRDAAAPQALRLWLEQLPHPWGQPLLRDVFEALPAIAAHDHVMSWRAVLDGVAHSEPPSIADSIARVGRACPPGWAPVMARTARDLARRGELDAALDEAASRDLDSSTLPTTDERQP